MKKTRVPKSCETLLLNNNLAQTNNYGMVRTAQSWEIWNSLWKFSICICEWNGNYKMSAPDKKSVWRRMLMMSQRVVCTGETQPVGIKKIFEAMGSSVNSPDPRWGGILCSSSAPSNRIPWWPPRWRRRDRRAAQRKRPQRWQHSRQKLRKKKITSMSVSFDREAASY